MRNVCRHLSMKITLPSIPLMDNLWKNSDFDLANNEWDHLTLKLYIVVDRTRVGGKKAEQTSCQRSMLAAIRKYPLFLIYRSSSPNAQFCVFS